MFDLTWGVILEIIALNATFAVALLAYLNTRNKQREDRLDARFAELENRLRRSEEKQTELAETCSRRDEQKALVDPIYHQLTEIRQRLDHLFKDKK